MTKKVVVAYTRIRLDPNTPFDPPNSSTVSDKNYSYKNEVVKSVIISNDQLTSTFTRKYFLEDYITFITNGLNANTDDVMNSYDYYYANGIVEVRTTNYIEE